MKVAVIGAGGVGGYFGARWAEAGLDVTLLARGAHLEAINTKGLLVHSPLGDAHVDVPAVASASDVGEVDVVVVATKTWQLASLADIVELRHMRPSLASYSLGWSGHIISPLIDRDRARQPEFLGSRLGSHSPLSAPASPTQESRKPR